MTRNYRAVSAEFNAIYNGDLALEDGKKALAQNSRDDFWEILPVERVQISDDIKMPGEARNADFERAEEKAVIAIQKHSIYFDGKEHNPQIDEAYMLLGKARYFDSRFIPALEAFNFILARYPTSNSINTAKIWREKTNIRLQNEDVAIKNLKKLFAKEKLADEDFADASAMIAQAYINMEHLDSAVTHINDAAAHVKDNEAKGRYYFIKGQIYNRLNQKDSANAAFDEVIALNRKSPRAYMIRAELEKIKNFDYESKNPDALLEHLNELAENRENRPFLDAIYHQKGQYFQKLDSIDRAIKNYNRSIKEFRQDEKMQVANYLTLGDIYFDRAEYKTAGKYYDTTLQQMERKSKDFRLVKKKRDNLDDVIHYEDIAIENDSILKLVAMSPTERMAYFTDYTNQLKEKAINDSIAKAKEKDRGDFASDEFFEDGEGSGSSSDGFYFYNTTTVASGKQEFARRWGDRSLEDDWRLSDKSQSSRSPEEEEEDAEGEDAVAGNSIEDDPQFQPETYLAEVPTDEKVIDSISKERDMAYYQLGLIYQEKFKEYQLAVDRLETLLTFDPEERLVVPSKYYLYKLYGNLENDQKEQAYKNDIIENHPETRYAEILQNPDAALADDESSPEFKYKELYRKYKNQHYEEVIEGCDKYIRMYTGEEIVPKFELLKATAIGKQDGFVAYKEALNYVSLNYPNSKEGKQAAEIYKTTLSKVEKFDFEKNNDSENWKVVYTFDISEKEDATALQEKIDEAIQELEYTYLNTSVDYYTSSKIFVVVHGLFSKDGAKGFAELLKENKDYKIENPYFEISSPNYTVVQIHKNVEAYNEKLK